MEYILDLLIVNKLHGHIMAGEGKVCSQNGTYAVLVDGG
jgi:hypothetical protein